MQDPDPDFQPVIGEAEALAPGLRRIVAPNPSPMTFRGTNTYLLGERDLAVIDPGPDSDAHLAAILDAVGPGARISHILVTHSHVDHSPLAARLAHETGAPVWAMGDHLAGRSEPMRALAARGLVGGGEGVDTGFAPHETLADGDTLRGAGWEVTALATPGHMGNHMAFAWDGALFCGDLVMGWASSLVSPPDGDLTDFMASCRRLAARDWQVFHSGHGAPITDPAGRLDWLITHREGREAQIVAALSDAPGTATALARRIYHDIPEQMLPAASRNVLAHLIDLTTRGIARPDGELTESAEFFLSR